jgi:hypothetical protein
MNETFVPTLYDKGLERAKENAIAAVTAAIANGNSPKRIQELTASQNDAIGLWNTHVTRIDKENSNAKNSTQDEGVIWGLVYVLLSVIYEAMLFFARMLHEKEDYSVLKSKLKARKQRENSEKEKKEKSVTVEAAKMTEQDLYAGLLAIIQENKREKKEQEKKISLLEGALAGK